MHRWKTIAFNVVFALNCLLLFLVFFEDRLFLPAWLQVAGRMHPLILHFPIVLIVLTIFWELLPGNKAAYAPAKARVGDVLLLSAAFSSVVTSLVGLFLSREDGYTPDILQVHKWGGVAVSVLTLGWYSFRHRVRQAKFLLVITTALGLVTIVLTGHQGANITHGENFLLAPLAIAEEKPKVLLEDAVVYTHMVKPILESKCTGCHNEKKAKGELVMETKATLLKGGKTGALWDSTEKDYGLMFQRIHLPLDHKKHMPPQGRPQLTDEEIQVLYHWVKSGADFQQRVTDLPEEDTLRLLATKQFQTIETDTYTFEAAPESEIQKLTTNYRVISRLAMASPALGVEFFGPSQFRPEQLKELLPLKEQIVVLSLSKMPVKDEDLPVIAQFKNLRKLNLSFTNVSGTALRQLNALQELKQLSLSGTAVQAKDVGVLDSLSKLSRLFVWNTAIEPKDTAQIAARLKNVVLETGYQGDTVLLKLTPPIVENENQIFKKPELLKLKHYINGAVIRYTLDGSEPDSLQSPVYTKPVLLEKNTVVKARVFKPGWISSDAVEMSFYKAGFRPDSVRLLTEPDPRYRGDGGSTLMDAEKGILNFRSSGWLGYNTGPLEALFFFNKPVPVCSAGISGLVDIGGYIMPPQFIEIWGGADAKQLRLLHRLVPKQPTASEPAAARGYELNFPATSVNVIKVVVRPLIVMPSWHPGKGEKGWAFVDEVLFN